MQVGDPVGTGAQTKQVVNQQYQGTPFGSNVLHGGSVTSIAQGQTANTRERNVVNLRGFKIRVLIKNTWNGGAADRPLFLNFCLISPKHATTTLTTTDFFRNPGDLQRAIDFDNSFINGFDRGKALGINTDKYALLWKKTMTLGVANSQQAFSGGAGGPRNYAYFKKYVPIKRQLRFDSGLDTSGFSNIFFIWWVNAIDEGVGNVSVPGACDAWARVTTYFREPKN